jgi:hypothetical protein
MDDAEDAPKPGEIAGDVLLDARVKRGYIGYAGQKGK